MSPPCYPLTGFLFTSELYERLTKLSILILKGWKALNTAIKFIVQTLQHQIKDLTLALTQTFFGDKTGLGNT